jgi:hypothetical protein
MVTEARACASAEQRGLMWPGVRWFEQLNEGSQRVDCVAAQRGWLWYRVIQKQLSERGEL